MNADQFYQSRRADWQRLSTLLDRSQANIGQLSPDEVKQMGQLYRAVTSDLAVAQREFPRHQVTTYLNQLVARGHAVLYRSEPLALRQITRFVRVTFPRMFRATWRFQLTAVLLLLVPALLAGLWLNWRIGAADWLLPTAVQSLLPMIEEQELWVDIPVAERPYTSTFIMTNNIRVAVTAFAGGLTAGLLTIYVLLFNGLLLGAVTGVTAHYDVGFELWTFVIGHGVIELTTIYIAGASGLMMGWAIIHPGLHRRRDALTQAARRAVVLIGGCIPLLVIAGIIEGFISPNENIPVAVKWAVGIGTGIVLYAYLLLASRNAPGE
ncbi:MAG: stage II sporulation protein M [Chloroflexi bacterium]|nr:stage II sporulation protein M [Ardenticatenaceae bacterium]MBL1128713.1 stage II sporulation protein M [Chloroflexota bacterium]NOG34791.1 stage II sporulation protein M [Chloroflexota bacterium]GIK57528.1 MAG: hypothetical protein BroJett015_31910 [Chloroflexota bacterium]